MTLIRRCGIFWRSSSKSWKTRICFETRRNRRILAARKASDTRLRRGCCKFSGEHGGSTASAWNGVKKIGTVVDLPRWKGRSAKLQQWLNEPVRPFQWGIASRASDAAESSQKARAR